MFKKSRFFPATALALLLCVAGPASACASPPPPEEIIPQEAAITKDLRLPAGTTTPDVTFHFTAAPISLDGFQTEAALDAMPPLNGSGLMIAYRQNDNAAEPPDSNIMSIKKPAGNLFAGVVFPHAGVYVYEIRETDSAAMDGGGGEWLYCSDAVYTLTVYVKNNPGGGTYVYATGIVDDGGDKVDTIVFTNGYVKAGKDGSLAISKEVGGDFADREQTFDFTMTLAAPSIFQDVPAFYDAYIVEAGEEINAQEDTYVKALTAGETKFSLKHGQQLVILGIPAGTVYTVTEAAAELYTPSVNVVTNGVEVPFVNDAKANTALSTREQLVGESDNLAAYTNTRNSVTPTGVNLNNLPFVILVALGLVALTAFVTVKVHRRNHKTGLGG